MASEYEQNCRYDEILSEKVRSYKMLYDKTEQGYKEKTTTVENAWREIAQELDFIEDTKAAKTGPKGFSLRIFYFVGSIETSSLFLFILHSLIRNLNIFKHKIKERFLANLKKKEQNIYS